jgi:cyclophilin family peptidyl-prolyl cis-trans isomerase
VGLALKEGLMSYQLVGGVTAYQGYDGAGSQFFIVVDDSSFLDNNYTAFGRVIKGMKIVDKIVNVPRDQKDNPKSRVEMKSVKIVKR